MTDLDDRFHVYEVVGEVLLRRSGRHVAIQRFMHVRTRGMVLKRRDDGSVEVQLSVITSGYVKYSFKRWMTGWVNDEDNLQDDLHSGRPIDILIPLESYQHILQTNREPGKPIRLTPDSNLRGKPFDHLVAAVLINDVWTEPL